MARLKAGDQAAFEAIYEAYRPRLFGFLVRLSRRRDVAEDLLEETWLRLVTRAGTLTDDARVGPWLFTVARNLYFSWRRSRAVDETRVTELDPSWPAPERGASPFEAAARAELEGRWKRPWRACPSGIVRCCCWWASRASPRRRRRACAGSQRSRSAHGFTGRGRGWPPR